MEINANQDTRINVTSSTMNGKIVCGISDNNEPINRSSSLQEGLILTWIIHGKGNLTTPHHVFEINDGCKCIRHPKLDYTLTLFSGVNHKRCYLALSDEIFNLLLCTYPKIVHIPAVTSEPFNQKLYESFFKLINKINNMSNTESIQLLPAIQHFIINFLNLDKNNSSIHRLLKHAQGILRTDFVTPLPDIAQSCNLSYSHFRKQFLLEFKTTPGRYRNEQRIEQAQHLLSTGLSCSDTCYKLNYPDLSTFSHQFKAICNITPTQYQKQYIL